MKDTQARGLPSLIRERVDGFVSNVRGEANKARGAVRDFLTTDSPNGAFTMSVSPSARAGPVVSPLRAAPFAALIPGDSIPEEVITTGLSSFLSLYNGVLIGRLLLTWFPNPPMALVAPLSTLCDPYLNLFRGIIPPIGGTIDLSPILAFVVLDFFTGTAASLPAEIKGKDAEKVNKLQAHAAMNPSRGVRAWAKRRAAMRAAKKQEQAQA